MCARVLLLLLLEPPDVPADEIADNLREHGSFIPGIRPGARTASTSNILTRITLAGAAFLA
jgi:preprotein translocase subunit SecY